MKKALLLVSMFALISLSYAQNFVVVRTSTRLTIDPTKAKYTVSIDNGQGFKYLKDKNGNDLRSEAAMLEQMKKDGWKIISILPESTTGGNLSYTKFFFSKEE